MNITFNTQLSLTEDKILKAKARNFEVIIDEPLNAGGQDKGPTPTEYLLFALGGCIGISIETISKEMKIKIKNFKIDISGSLNPLKFLGRKTEDRAGFNAIQVNIKIDSDEDKEKIKDLIKRVEERCPITDNLTNFTKVEINII